MAKILNTRAIAAQLSWKIIDQGKSLDAVLKNYFEAHDVNNQDRAFVQELVYGVCRWYGALNKSVSNLLRSPIRKKDRIVHYVILVGLYQLRYLQTAEHAAVGETVNACTQLNKQWAKKLINGCLRSYLRNNSSESSDKNNDNILSHPDWLNKELRSAWPEQFNDIVACNNIRPPMCLRVNRRINSVDEYLAKLDSENIAASTDPYSEDGIILEQAVSVSALPDFFAGAVSVQDTAAQIACDFLPAQAEMHVLDACAAPGGKTAHLLERHNNQLNMTALDVSESRCEQLQNTLQRLNLDANIVCSDASQKPNWTVPLQGYDRILIDAPCSGVGVIRRHPDIKHHRTLADVEALEKTQAAILNNLWPLLKPGGLMLYMTCSILPQENEQQISKFVGNQNDAMLTELKHPNALKLKYGVQTLPGIHNMDGFFYSLLTKQ